MLFKNNKIHLTETPYTYKNHRYNNSIEEECTSGKKFRKKEMENIFLTKKSFFPANENTTPNKQLNYYSHNNTLKKYLIQIS